MQADEKRLIAYALDLPVEVSFEQDYVNNETKFWIIKGTLYRQLKSIDRREYTLKNKDADDRDVIIEVPVAGNWELREPQEPFEKTADLMRFKAAVPAGKTTRQKIVLESVRDESVALANVGLNNVRMYLRSRVISPAVKAALERVIEMRNAIDQVGAQRADAERKAQTAVEDQERIRRNLDTLRDSSDQRDRQLQKFGVLESEIERWRQRVDELSAEEQQQQQALDAYLLSLKLD